MGIVGERKLYFVFRIGITARCSVRLLAALHAAAAAGVTVQEGKGGVKREKGGALKQGHEGSC